MNATAIVALAATVALLYVLVPVETFAGACPPDKPFKGWGLNADKCCRTGVNKLCHRVP
jgi:hypothetical protein